jgi:hypothetical protein
MTDQGNLKKKILKILFFQVFFLILMLIMFFYLSSKTANKLDEFYDVSEQLKLKRDSLELIANQYQKMNSQLTELNNTIKTDYNELISVKATAKSIGTFPNGQTKYLFKIFIDADESTLKKIEKVKYEFLHETFQNPAQISTNASNHFSKGYEGWGVMSNVPVTITFKSGEIKKLDFNMRRHIGWDIAY